MLIVDDLIEPIQKAINVNKLLTKEQAKASSKKSKNIVYGTFGTFSIKEDITEESCYENR